MPKNISYDYSLMMQDVVGKHGISEVKLNKLEQRMKGAHKQAHALLASGEQGFIQTLSDKTELELIKKTAKKIQSTFSQLLVIGIGGSDLGARALQSIFASNKSKVQILFLGDTTDPEELDRICSQIDWKSCAINPVSKSGNTVEPLSTFLYVQKKLIKAVGKKRHADHVFVTTQDSDSIFRQLVDQYGYTLVPHPMNIGGRWTILSVVGLLSAAASGIAADQLRKGALDYYRKANKQMNNAAMIYAALHYLGQEKGKSLAVLMPYSSRLEQVGGWYRQLFAESLGKEKTRSKKTVNTGLTPIAANGPKDQHSQVQLYASGPFDKLITFIRLEQSSKSNRVPVLAKSHSAAYLSKMRFHEILNHEQEATAIALASKKRPSGTIVLPELSEYSIGQLICFFELACVYLAELLDINAFDQPGVEEGKKNMYALLGKEGFEDQASKLKQFRSTSKKRIV